MDIQSHGVAGLVTDGFARDTDEIIMQRNPVACRGIGRTIIPGRVELTNRWAGWTVRTVAPSRQPNVSTTVIPSSFASCLPDRTRPCSRTIVSKTYRRGGFEGCCGHIRQG